VKASAGDLDRWEIVECDWDREGARITQR
jgi:hypothetical protein